MKPRRPTAWETIRSRLVLTAQEKRVIAFILMALILGLTTKHYRDHHPPDGKTIVFPAPAAPQG